MSRGRSHASSQPTGAGRVPTALASSTAEALLALLRRRTGCAELRFAAPTAALSGGFFAEIVALRFAGAPPDLSGDLVLRTMPDNDRSRREVIVQQVLADQGFATPRVRLAGDSDAGLGRPFLLMDRARGGSLASGLGARETAMAFRRMPRLLAEAMVALHALDPAPLARALAGGGWPAARVGVGEVLDEIESSSALRLVAGLAPALRWLRAARPDEARLAVCHGDLQPLNLIVDHGALSAVVDWTNARLAEPAFDVAYTVQTLEQMPIALPAWLQSLRRRFGRRAAQQFLAAHEAIAPIDRSRLGWYDALHAVRLLVRVAERCGEGGAAALAANHPWVLSVDDVIARVARHTGERIDLPPRSPD